MKPRQLGWVAPEGTSFRCFAADPSRVRRADVSFIAIDRLTRDQAAAQGHCTVVPDLVVEVVSPRDLADEVDAKVVEWLAAGVKLLWVVYTRTRVVRTFHPDGGQSSFHEADTLTADPVLPGFAVPVADLFRLPGAAPAAVG